MSNIKKKLLGVLQYYRILPILHEHANPACPLLVSMAIHGFDVAAGMSPEACSKCAHIFTVAAQYTLRLEPRRETYYSAWQEAGQLSVYVWRSTESPYNLFTIYKRTCNFLRCFAKKRSSAQQETAMLGLAEGKTILDRQYYVVLGSSVKYCSIEFYIV